MKKGKQHQRRDDTKTCSTVKQVRNPGQDDHLNPFDEKHYIDVAKNLARQETSQNNKRPGVEEAKQQQLEDALDAAGMPSKNVDEDIDIDGLSRGDDVRGNLVREDGEWKKVEGQDWRDFMANLRHEHSEYYETNGVKRKRGDENFTEPLNNIFLRLPPWLALELENDNVDAIKKTICRLGDKFEEETGYPVHAINIHKERANDLHIHVTYTDVKQPPVKLSAKFKREHLAKERQQVKSDLIAAGKKHDPASVRREMDSKVIEFPIPPNKIRYQKIIKASRSSKKKGRETKGKRGIYAERRMNVLGSAYRYKAVLWDAAIGEQKEEVRKFRDDYPDSKTSFTYRVTKCDDLEESYLDYWAEHQFEAMILANLSDERLASVEAKKAEHVEAYLIAGYSAADPLEIALAAELTKDMELISLVQDTAIAVEQAELDKKEESVVKRESEVDDKLSKIADMEESVIERKADVDAQLSDIAKKEESVAERESDVESVLSKKDAEIADQLSQKDAELDSAKEQIQADAEKKVWSQVGSAMSKQIEDATPKKILSEISKDSKKAAILDIIKPKLGKVITKVASSKRLPKWITRALINIGSDLGISSDSDSPISSSEGV